VDLGEFFEGILLHRVLHRRHMVSVTSRYPMSTLYGLLAKTPGDGLFRAATFFMKLSGLVFLWGAA